MKRIACILAATVLVLAFTPAQGVEAASISNAQLALNAMNAIAKSKTPKKTYDALSSFEKDLVKKELNGTVKISTRAPSGARKLAAGCWEREVVAEFIGGLTRSKMLLVAQATKVCSNGKKVSSVSIVDARTEISRPGFTRQSLEKATRNVDWEGRGVARADFAFGGNGWTLTTKQLCAQIRLNADRVHYSASGSASLYS